MFRTGFTFCKIIGPKMLLNYLFMSKKEGHIKQTLDEVFLYNIYDLTKACDCLDNLPIAIYHLENEKIVYSNAALEKILGPNRHNLLDEGWNYWYSRICPMEMDSIKKRVNNILHRPFFKEPYILKYHITNQNGKKLFLRHEIMFHFIEQQTFAINYFFDISEKEIIEAYFQQTKCSKTIHTERNLTSISPREKEVLMLVADGFSSKQIADRLFISNHTAISHRKNLIEKFKVKNTAQLIKKATWNLELW